MQISKIYSIYDRKAQYYLPLFNDRTDADAIRRFTEIVTVSDTPVSKYPADYDLVRLGALDLESGQIVPEYPVGTLLNGLVALQNAQTERSRYKVLLERPEQVDIEEILAENP